MQVSKRNLLSAMKMLVLPTARTTATHAKNLNLVVIGGPDNSAPRAIPDFPGAVNGTIVGDLAGTCREVLTPLIESTLVGSNGLSTFRFHDGTISTRNVSRIVNNEAIDGELFLFVETVGVLAGATGAFAGRTGGFTSSSLVSASTFFFVAGVEMELN